MVLILPTLSIPDSTYHFASKAARLEAGNISHSRCSRSKKIAIGKVRPEVFAHNLRKDVLLVWRPHGKACTRAVVIRLISYPDGTTDKGYTGRPGEVPGVSGPTLISRARCRDDWAAR